MSLKVFFGVVMAAAAAGGAHQAYLGMTGYPASKIEADLCKGRRLVEKEDGKLDCSRTLVGDPIPVSYKKEYPVDPAKMFLLSDMRPLCIRPREEPRDMGGELGCMPKDDKTAKK